MLLTYAINVGTGLSRLEKKPVMTETLIPLTAVLQRVKQNPGSPVLALQASAILPPLSQWALIVKTSLAIGSISVLL